MPDERSELSERWKLTPEQRESLYRIIVEALDERDTRIETSHATALRMVGGELSNFVAEAIREATNDTAARERLVKLPPHWKHLAEVADKECQEMASEEYGYQDGLRLCADELTAALRQATAKGTEPSHD